MRLQQSRHGVVGTAQLANPSRNASMLKAILRAKGCDLPFYDHLDSYEQEFQRIVAKAKGECRSLVNVRVVDDFGYCGDPELERNGLTEIVFDGDRADNGTGFVNGRTECFADDRGALRTFVQIAMAAALSVQPNEAKYLFAISALLHEIGHVCDIENGIHFNVAAKTMASVEADVSAQLFVFEKLGERGLRQPYEIHLRTLSQEALKEGKSAEVARQVLRRLPKRRLVNWSDFL